MRGIKKAFGAQVALAGVSLKLAAGEVHALVGENGAGKSTLMKILSGAYQPDSGEMWVDGKPYAPANPSEARQRGVGMIYQELSIAPHLSVAENIAFGPRSLGASKKDAQIESRAQMDSLRITELADQKPGQISGGQAQRVALARALATRPNVLLLDEPLAALDAQTRESVRTELERQIKAFAGCVVFVTHDPFDAMLLADRVIVLENGVITQMGTQGELAARPATDYVATLMGVNLIRGQAQAGVLHVDGGGVLQIPQHTLEGEVLAVLRPEAITLHLNKPEGSARNVWEGTVSGLAPMHDRIRVSVQASPSVIATITHAALTDLNLAVGTSIWVSAKTLTIEAFCK